MVNLDLALFVKTPSDFHYLNSLNSESDINPCHLHYFEFIGKLFGFSIINPMFFICPSFSRILYKLILSETIQIEDLIAEKFPEGVYYQELRAL